MLCAAHTIFIVIRNTRCLENAIELWLADLLACYSIPPRIQARISLSVSRATHVLVLYQRPISRYKRHRGRREDKTFRAEFARAHANLISLTTWLGAEDDLYTERIFMAIFTTLSVVIWFSTGTLGIFSTLVYVFTMRVVIYDIPSMAIISKLSTSILFCNLCYILLWISLRNVVKIAIRI